MRKIEAGNRNRRHARALIAGRRRGAVKVAARRAKRATLSSGASLEGK